MRQTAKRRLKRALLSLLIIFIILLFTVTYYVENRVQQTCKMALAMYPGDKIEALIDVAKQQYACTKEKSRALWALGQLGDKKALPYLIENFEGLPETGICIYEAQFAIEKIRKNSFNLPAFL